MELIDTLKSRLLEYNYNKYSEGLINGVQFSSVIKTRRVSTVRIICAVLEVPKNIVDVEDTEDFFSKIRKSLSYEYARFPYFKEIGTFTILLCEHSLYMELKGKEKLFIDKTGFHANVMLGTCLIDSLTFEHSSESVRLIQTGKHFQAIKEVISSWCEFKIKQM
jgi:hypothetical protein